jgi:hypothetical protein
MTRLSPLKSGLLERFPERDQLQLAEARGLSPPVHSVYPGKRALRARQSGFSGLRW